MAVVHTPAVFTLLPLIHSSISCNLASSPSISLQLLLLKSEIMTSYMTKTTKHFQNFSDLSLNIFMGHIFVTVDTANHVPHRKTLLLQLPQYLPFFSNCHLKWLFPLGSTFSSLLTLPVILADFIYTHVLKFHLYANNSQVYLWSMSSVPIYPTVCWTESPGCLAGTICFTLQH